MILNAYIAIGVLFDSQCNKSALRSNTNQNYITNVIQLATVLHIINQYHMKNLLFSRLSISIV